MTPPGCCPAESVARWRDLPDGTRTVQFSRNRGIEIIEIEGDSDNPDLEDFYETQKTAYPLLQSGRDDEAHIVLGRFRESPLQGCGLQGVKP